MMRSIGFSGVFDYSGARSERGCMQVDRFAGPLEHEAVFNAYEIQRT